MPGQVPNTRSGGRIQLRYTGPAGIPHTTSLRFVDGQFPTDYADAAAVAAEFGSHVKPLFSAAAGTIAGWALLDNDGTILAEGPFTEPLAGTATATGTEGSVSPTIAFLGVATADNLTEKVALTKITLFTGDTWPIPAQDPTMPVSTYPAWVTFFDWLNGHERLFADFYGRKAVPRDYVAVQYNAHVQRKRGA